MTDVIDYKNAKGWLTDGERELLFRLAGEVSPAGQILNIGVEFGASLACLKAGVRTANIPGVRIIGVDLDISKVVSTYGCDLMEVDSHQLLMGWPNVANPARLDLIFVDGDHGEIGVTLDAQFSQWLPIGGVIAFQDCFDWGDYSIPHQLVPGVNQAVTKWFDNSRAEFEELPSVDTTRIFRRIKADEQPITNSSGADTNVQPTKRGNADSREPASKPTVQRPNKGSNRPGQRRP